MFCKCPAEASIDTIPQIKCPENFGQIQKIAFQRLMNDSGEKNCFIKESSDITKLVSWTPLLAAVDSTKVVVSPYIYAPTEEEGAERTFGGGNESLGGITENIGREPNSFTGSFKRIPQNVINTIKKLQCESIAHNLGVYLFNEHGQIEALKDSAIEDKFYPIPIESLFIGDKVHGGLEAPDSNSIKWLFLPNYSDTLTIITPEFNPLELAPAE